MCGPEEVAYASLCRRYKILSSKTERKVILMRYSDRFDDDVGWLYWKYCVRVWVASLWLGAGLYCGRVPVANAPGCTAAEGLLYKPWSLVVPTCTARCLHQRHPRSERRNYLGEK